MSSVQTCFYGQTPYYLDQSRLSVDNTSHQYSYVEDLKEQKNNTSRSQRIDQSIDTSHIKTPEEGAVITVQKPKTIVSLLPDALVRKIQSRKQQITIYFFNSQKRMCFQKEQVNRHFQKKQNITVRQLITYVVKSYCRLMLNFQPIQISQQTFQLKLANFQNHDDGVIDSFSYDLSIQFLYQADNLVLVRKPRPLQKINDWTRLLTQKPDVQIVQILMPEKKELTLQIQKSKTVSFLKQKFSSYTTQLGKIVLVSYHNFKLCQNKKKIIDLDQKIFQVYRQRIENYLDKPVDKNFTTYNFNNVNYYEQLWKSPSRNQDPSSDTIQQYFVNQTSLMGKLTLSLTKSAIIQKYQGGVISKFPLSIFNSNQRMKQYSIHILIGIKNNDDQLVFKFIFKDREEKIVYKFQQRDKKQKFLRNLLKLGRIYNKKWQKIND